MTFHHCSTVFYPVENFELQYNWENIGGNNIAYLSTIEVHAAVARWHDVMLVALSLR